mgnify:CR=1 FL=1
MSMTKEYIFTMAFEDGDYQKEWKCIVTLTFTNFALSLVVPTNIFIMVCKLLAK